MGKVVIEKPRTHSEYGYKAVRHNNKFVLNKLKNLNLNDLRAANDDDIEDVLEHIETGGIEPMLGAYYSSSITKDFTDVLGPISGYLHSKVGCLWNDVWSDVCENLRGGYVVEHVRGHVEDMVDFEGFDKYGTWRSQEDIKYAGRFRFRAEFYVDEHGVLQRKLPAKKIPKYEYKSYGKIGFLKEQDDRFWKLNRYANPYFRFVSKKRYDEYDEKMNNFRLFIKDDIEYILLNNIWFTFEFEKQF